MVELAAVKPFLDYGIIAGLFIFTLWYLLKTTKEREETMRKDSNDREERMLKDSKEREDKLHTTLNTFGQKYDLIHKDILDIKEELKK
ncbi:hypothetical protein LHV56_19150 [Peribacillus frigoritolerans]|uniref:hypothetical protein n=1 Tax=Peribacillus frigoritolerans TaxID=450367 RepID=UPI002079E31A|nr:hypothetical protein [Peribacillus frigoritolerans]USK78951.1 hypothetical protein LHV56_19150 [Peribacillus frigoritolerans]